MLTFSINKNTEMSVKIHVGNIIQVDMFYFHRRLVSALLLIQYVR